MDERPVAASGRRPTRAGEMDVLNLATQPGHPGREREAGSWEGLTAAIVRRQVDEVVLEPLDRHLVLINTGRPFRLEERIGGRQYQTSGAWGDVAVIPAGVSAVFRTRGRQAQEVESLAIVLDPAHLARAAAAADLDPSRVELLSTAGARSPRVERIGLAIRDEIAQDDALSGSAVEALAAALAVHLLREHSALPGSVPGAGVPARGGLAGADLRRALDYVDSHLDQRLMLAEIAATVNLSPYHFARLFKQATGWSPHQYVLQRRIERARALILGTNLSLVDIAHLAGFADQSHLTRQMTRALGISPHALRRASR